MVVVVVVVANKGVPPLNKPLGPPPGDHTMGGLPLAARQHILVIVYSSLVFHSFNYLDHLPRTPLRQETIGWLSPWGPRAQKPLPGSSLATHREHETDICHICKEFLKRTKKRAKKQANTLECLQGFSSLNKRDHLNIQGFSMT